MHKAEEVSCGDILDTYPYVEQSYDQSLEPPQALVAMYPILAAELAAERKRHHEESLRLANDNKELETCLKKTTKQLGDAKRRMEMRATEYSRTSFELRRENCRVQVKQDARHSCFAMISQTDATLVQALLVEAASARIIPTLNDNFDELLASRDPAHMQFCADISQGHRCVVFIGRSGVDAKLIQHSLFASPCSQFISSDHIGAITSLIFNYYDLPKVLKAEAFLSFGELITGSSPTVLKGALLEFTGRAFAGRCRVRSLWNLLQRNNKPIVPDDLLPVLEVASAWLML
jgi:hypothetical protein